MSDDKSDDSPISWIPALDCEWDETLSFLCSELLASKTSSEAREQFFAGYRNACKRVAFRLLSGWKWRGDLQRDAEDIASESTKILLGQEARGSGIFGLKVPSGMHLRGYLTRTIWRSSLQIAMRMQPRTVLLSLEKLLGAGWDFEVSHSRPQQELRAELMEILAALEATRSNYRKLPKGMSLLDCLLWAEFWDGPLKGIKKRTFQRYVSQIRLFLTRQLGAPDDVLSKRLNESKAGRGAAVAPLPPVAKQSNRRNLRK